MRTKPRGILFVTVMLFIALSVIAQRFDLLVFAIPPLVFLLYTSLVSFPQEGDIIVHRRVSTKRAFQGDVLNVAVDVSNESGKSFRAKISDTIPEDLEVVEGSNKRIAYMAPGETISLRYKVRARNRGHYSIGPLVLSLYDPLFLEERTLSINVLSQVAVFPRIIRVPRLELKARVTGKWPGEVVSKKVGRGTEFLEISEYKPGDEPRFINWKATARRRKLMTNRFSAEKITDVLLIVDVPHWRLVGPTLTPYLNDFLASISASIAIDLLSKGNRVSLLIIGEYRDWVKPGFGKRHALRILHSLADLRFSPVRQVVSFRDVFMHVLPYLSPVGSQLIIVSTFTESDVYELIAEGQKLGFKTLCIGVDPFKTVMSHVPSARNICILSETWKTGVIVILGNKCDLVFPGD